MVLQHAKFEVMHQSLLDETKDMPPDVGISVALWKLKALMDGYKWALDNGMTHGT